MSTKTDEIIEQLKGLTLTESYELVKQIEKTFEVDASAIMSSGAAVAIQTPSVNEEVSVEEKTEFDVILQEVPSDKRVSGILAIRKITPLGISEAKQFIDSLPKAICVGVSKEKAEEAKKILEDSGSVAIIK